ncbi:MAG: glutathione S-transferase family protein [Bdellovibrionota bacterium]
MSPLILYIHPLSSFCHKVLFPFYENGVKFRAETLNLQDRDASADFYRDWPLGKIPLLRDKDQVIPESTVILEYVDQNYPGPMKLFPADPAACREARLWDRILDSYVHIPMQNIVANQLRPEGLRDALNVAEAKDWMSKSYDLLERRLESRKWILGHDLSVADCAALPALFYGGVVHPFAKTHPNIAAYFERLYALPSVKRTLEEAKPFFRYFPFYDELPARFR